MTPNMTPKSVEYYFSMSHHRKKSCTTYINLVNNGINYQPQLVNARISESSNLWGYLSTLQSQLWAAEVQLSSNCRFCKYVNHSVTWNMKILEFLQYIIHNHYILMMTNSKSTRDCKSNMPHWNFIKQIHVFFQHDPKNWGLWNMII